MEGQSCFVGMGRRQVFDFGEAKNLDILRGRGVLKHVLDLILKIYDFLNIILIYYIKQPISLIFVIGHHYVTSAEKLPF